MVSGGIKVIVRTGRIFKEDLPNRISPFIRIKAGSRLADSKKLSLDSIKNQISWNESLSLVFSHETQLYIYLLDADRKIAQFQNEIGVCVLNLQMLALNQKQQVFGAFYSNNKLSALIELQVFYEVMLQEKIQAALLQLMKKETMEQISYQQPDQQVYEVINLKFRVIQATITHNTQAIGDMSPYCLIKIRQKGDYKTDIKKGKNPKFDQLFIIEGISEDMILELSLWDKQTMKQDDHIGGTTINLRDIMTQQSTIKDIPIKYYDGKKYLPAGTIRCEYSVF